MKASGEYGPGACTADYAPVSRRPDKENIEDDPAAWIEALREEMLVASAALEFEKAAALRDEINRIASEHGMGEEKGIRRVGRRSGRRK